MHNPNGLPLTAQLVTGPANGTLTLNADGSFSYTPNAGFWGTDSFTYTATDGPATSTPATVTITVYSVPVANNDTYTVRWATAGSSRDGRMSDANGDEPVRGAAHRHRPTAA